MRVLFGEWTFDVETRQLHHGEKEVHLSTKAFDLLRLLIDARPRVLSKAELQEALWPHTFVSEASLFTLVSEIRTALGDDPRHSQFVRTVHNVGYAFNGAAVDVGREVQASVPSATWMLMWESRQFPLAEGEHVIGRDLDIAVTLESTTVTRRHARLRVTTSAVTIEDLDSKNGTFLNDVRVAGEMNVADGDRIRFGSLLTTFRRLGSFSSTETEHVDGKPGEAG